MTGSLRQRGPDTWELRVYLGVEQKSGRERWATKTVHDSRRHATARLAEFVEDVGYARLRAGTVADLLDRWMAHASPAWSSTTLAQTRSIVEHHLKPLLGEIRVNKSTTIDIDDMYRSLSRCGGRDGRPLTAGTVHRVHVVLHRALTQAVRWEWIWLNPAANSSPPRVTPGEIRPPTPDQVQRLVASVEATDLDFATYLWLAASSGARRSQMLGLRWADIDFTHSAIGFSRAFVDGPAGSVLRATKIHRTYRVALDHASMQRLVDHYQRSTQRATRHGHVVADRAFVFSVECLLTASPSSLSPNDSVTQSVHHPQRVRTLRTRRRPRRRRLHRRTPQQQMTTPPTPRPRFRPRGKHHGCPVLPSSDGGLMLLYAPGGE